MVSQLKDETARHFQRMQVDMRSVTPESATLHFQAVRGKDIPTLRTELPTYHEGLQAKMLELDAASRTRLAALQEIASDAAT